MQHSSDGCPYHGGGVVIDLLGAAAHSCFASMTLALCVAARLACRLHRLEVANQRLREENRARYG